LRSILGGFGTKIAPVPGLRRLGIAAVVLAPLLFAPAAHAETAQAFLKRILPLRFEGKSGLAYASLHPAQKVYVVRERFIACDRQGLGGYKIRLTDIRPVRVYKQRAWVPGTKVTAPSTVVVMHYRLSINGGEPEDKTTPLHAFQIGPRWYWRLSAPQVAAFKQDACP
jgi:hypothetical protein